MLNAKARFARGVLRISSGCLIAAAATVVDAQAPAGRGQAAQGPNFLRLRLIQVMDNEGFGQPVEAFRLLVPVDWKVNAWLKYNMQPSNCRANRIDSGVQAVGPDGLIGFEIMGADAWRWVDDPQSRALMQRAESDLQRSTGATSCPWSPIVTAGDYFRQVVLPRRRPGAQLLGVEPETALTQMLENQARTNYGPMINRGLYAGYRVDAARMRLGYRVNNMPVEEWVIGAVLTLKEPSQGGMPANVTQSSADMVVAARTPPGRMQEASPLFEVILGTLRVNPQWTLALAEQYRQLAQIDGRGQQDRQRIWREAGQAIAGRQAEIYRNQQGVQSSVAGQFSQSIRGVQSYSDPTSGQPIELTGGYRQAFSNGRGEYILSNDPNFNPSAVLREQWQPMQPLRSPGG